MAQFTSTNLGDRLAAQGNQAEDVLSLISNIDRDETPFVSSIGTSAASSTLHEWLVDEYDNPADNAATEGSAYDASNANHVPRVRLNNYTQIFRKELGVSATAIATSNIGVGNEWAYQVKKKGVELRRDIERQYLAYSPTGTTTSAQIVKSSGATRRSGGFYAYAANWVNAATAGTPAINRVGTAGTTIAATAGDRTADSSGTSATLNFMDTANAAVLDGSEFVRFGGTAAALSADHINTAVERMYLEGGKPNVLMTPAKFKGAISQFYTSGGGAAAGTLSQRNLDAMAMKLNLAVTGVMTEFGFDIAIVPNYQMDRFTNQAAVNTSTIVMYEADQIKRAMLRPMQEVELDKGGDGMRGFLVCEEALEVRNPSALAVIGNITG